jgi:hypothetical protein
MRKLTRFFSGCLFGGALLTTGLAAFPQQAYAEDDVVLVCTATACCLVDLATNKLIDCVPIRTT